MSGRPIADLRDRRTPVDRTRSQLPTRQVIIVGAGGHGRELADIVKAIGDAGGGSRLIGIVDDGHVDEPLLARSGFRFLGTSDALADRDCEVQIGVGDPLTRETIDRRIGGRASSLVHPTAQIGSNVSLHAGAVVAQGAIVTTNVTIGRHSHVNIAASVSHDCTIGSYATICPGTRLSGNVTLGDRVFIGAGATVLPGVTIGHDAVVGAGAVVTGDVPSGMTVAGVPARPVP